MKNVLDLTGRLKGKTDKHEIATHGDSQAPVIDMTEKRAEIINQERRQVKRTILTEFIGAFALVPRKGLLKVTLHDISSGGLAFDVDKAAGHFAIGEEVAMRVYLNKQTYFPFVVKIQNIRGVEGDELFRHGAYFLQETVNEQALHHFIRFIETISAHLRTDKGDMQVSSVVR